MIAAIESETHTSSLTVCLSSTQEEMRWLAPEKKKKDDGSLDCLIVLPVFVSLGTNVSASVPTLRPDLCPIPGF